MDRLPHSLAAHWLDVLLLAVALVVGIVSLRSRQRTGTWSLGLLLTGASLGLAGLGGLILPVDWALWVASVALVALFIMLLVVVVTGNWFAPLGYVMGALVLVGLGGMATGAVGQGLVDLILTVVRLEPVEPWWLLLLGLVPLIVLLSYRSLAGLGTRRRWLAIGLRTAVVVCLVLALAEVRIRHPNETVTVLFLVDRSLSIPEEYDDADAESVRARVDRRWERVMKFINDSVEKRGPGHNADKAGVIVFGKKPRLELPPSVVKNLNFKEVSSVIDPNYTDIAAAMKLALASFPEGTGKRIVLISDGNENLGNVEEQARIARLNGVQIDVVPLAAGYRNENEVLVQSVEAPSVTEQSSQLPIRVLVRSYNPRPVEGLLIVRQETEGRRFPVPPTPIRVRVQPGLNPFYFKQSLAKQQQSYTYEAIFQPERVIYGNGEKSRDYLPGDDRPQNNRATTHVVALGQRRILFVEPKSGDHDLLLDQLRSLTGDSKFKVHAITAAELARKAELGAFLSSYDCLILANVPAENFSDEQQEIIRSNTFDQGCGLVMIGGPESFGAGGWQGTPVEKALPVDCDIKSLKVQGKGGLVLIMHASEMADGNFWQRKIAELAIKKLSSNDEVGVIYFDWGQTKWHIPLQVIGGRRAALLTQLDKLAPGDMPEFDTGLQMAYSSLTEPKRNLATKHIILISDGDPSFTNNALLGKMKTDKVTLTTVGVATHSGAEDTKLLNMAKPTGGRYHNPKSPKSLPQIYIQETRLVSQSFVYEKKFGPRLMFKDGPSKDLPDALNPLYGYVRTTAKASEGVKVPIQAPPSGDQEFPVLAYWQYGLGKAVAFTSDARSLPDRPTWDKDWAKSDMYLKFWEQVVSWALRAVETGRLVMTTEFRDGKVKVIVDARDANNRPMNDLMLKGSVTPPNPRVEDKNKYDLKFTQKGSGLYEAEFKAEDAGSYFINAQGKQQVKDDKGEVKTLVDGVRSGVTIPYSPEFADMETNTPLLEKVREMTGGKSFMDDAMALYKAAQEGEVFRHADLPASRSRQPVWHWLLVLACLFLFCDVAVRRIAVDPREAVVLAQKGWARLRGRAAATEETPQFMERLKSRKAQVSEAIDRERSLRRFEAGESVGQAPAGADATAPAPPPPRPRPQPQVAPEKEEAADYASRLLKAKKRVWQERDSDKKE